MHAIEPASRGGSSTIEGAMPSAGWTGRRAALRRHVLTGHKTEAVYRRYAIVDAATQKEGVEKLARMHVQPEDADVAPLRAADA